MIPSLFSQKQNSRATSYYKAARLSLCKIRGFLSPDHSGFSFIRTDRRQLDQLLCGQPNDPHQSACIGGKKLFRVKIGIFNCLIQ